MHKLFFSLGVFLILPHSSYAQNLQPQAAPSDVTLNFDIVGTNRVFHLGEVIPIKYSYTATAPDRYIWLDQSNKLEGGHPLEISCSPPTGKGNSRPADSDGVAFEQILYASCAGVGYGGGIGGGCTDCVRERSLTPAPLSFGVFPLNKWVRFRKAGAYTCEASSADVTTASASQEFRRALLLRSKPVVLTIVRDPAWAHSAAVSYGDQYQKLCLGANVPGHRFLQCSDVARQITYLDTADSLAIEVKWFDGRNHGWDNGFWDAIRHSSQPQLPLQLMTSRMQDPDFQVSTTTIEWLASADLRLQAPDAFEDGAAATYQPLALRSLDRYVRLLGSSLSIKDEAVLPESVKTYRYFAGQEYCEGEPLVPTQEQNQVLRNIR